MQTLTVWVGRFPAEVAKITQVYSKQYTIILPSESLNNNFTIILNLLYCAI